MSKLKWNISGYNRNTAVELVKNGFNPLVSVLLASRGVVHTEEADEITNPGPELQLSPFKLRDMDKAAERVKSAIEKREHIAVYGDYDVDGITASCLMANYLNKCGIECDIYIPDRLREGYGVKKDGISLLKDKGVTLIITVDCGITAVEEVEYAKQLGIDMIITDHHECGSELPRALAVVDPKREDSLGGEYLAGVGVALKLVTAIMELTGSSEDCCDYFDLAAVGTIADIMPLVGENRYIIRRGLDVIKRGKHAGIAALCKAAGIDPDKLTATSVGFILAPRINAAGRLGKTGTALQLMRVSDRDAADNLAKTLCDYNRERQRLEGEIYESAVKMIEEDPVKTGPAVLACEKWHQGIAGIVASRLCEKYNRPVIMVCIADGIGRGSCRSIPGFNLFSALAECSGYLLGYGGHEMAAGLTLAKDRLEDFKAAMGRCFEKYENAIPEPILNIDFEVIKPGLLTVENVSGLTQLEPYGNQNPSPVLCIKNAVIRDVVPLSEGKHTKFKICCFGEEYGCIAFSKTVEDLKIYNGAEADIAFTPQNNDFRGKQSVQLLITDVDVKKEMR